MGKRIPTAQDKHRFCEQELTGMLREATGGMVCECWYEPLAEHGRELVRISARPDRLHVQVADVEVEGCTLWQVAERAMAAVARWMAA